MKHTIGSSSVLKFAHSMKVPLRSTLRPVYLPKLPSSRRCISIAELDREKGSRERVVVLGSGWGGFVHARHLDPKKFQVLVVSPRSYFVFTPLLSGTAVGTLEFRTVVESIRNTRWPHIQYMQAWADDVSFKDKTILVEESVLDHAQAKAMTETREARYKSPGELSLVRAEKTRKGKMWHVNYDKLIVAVGCYSQTFGTKGVKENAFFLKDIGDARKIRIRVLECFEAASLPTTSDERRRQLLNFAVVGGGPTGMEFSAELGDLVREDIGRLYPGLENFVQISVYDVAPQVLSMFDEKLSKYAAKVFQRENIKIKTSHHVLELKRGLPRGSVGSQESFEDSDGCYTLVTKEDGEMGIGLCVWSTGNMMNPFIEKALSTVRKYPPSSAILPLDAPKASSQVNWIIKRHAKSGALLVDDQLHVQLETEQDQGERGQHFLATMTDVFALGDNAIIEGQNLPATAQTANQQALWLAKRLNKDDFRGKQFSFKNMGIMTYLGGQRGLLQTSHHHGIGGRTAWLIWRGAYLTMSVSWRNKVLIPVYWSLNWAFGRDISRF